MKEGIMEDKKLEQALKMLQNDYSIITVGESKVPNFRWAEQQTKKLSREKLIEYYNYKGGIFKKDETEIPATTALGYCTGFNDIEVVDIDLKVLPTLKAQTDFWDEYLSFLKDNIADFDDKFVIYKTVNNGYHIIYKCKSLEGNVKVARLKGMKEAIIETKGKGGYCFMYDKKISKRISICYKISAKNRRRGSSKNNRCC
jgi:hypothetical protein